MTELIVLHWQKLVALFFLAGIVGYLEQHAYNHEYRDDGWHIFGWLNPRHHIPMVAGEAIVCWGFGVWWFTPAFLVMEDVLYFVMDPDDTLGPEDWIARGLRGFYLGPVFIPWIYVIGMSLSSVLLFWASR